MSKKLNKYMVQTCVPSLVVINPDDEISVATDDFRKFGIDVEVLVLDTKQLILEDFRNLCFFRDEVQLMNTQDLTTWNSIRWYESTFSYEPNTAVNQEDEEDEENEIIVLRMIDVEHKNFVEIRFKKDVVSIKITCKVEFKIPTLIWPGKNTLDSFMNT